MSARQTSLGFEVVRAARVVRRPSLVHLIGVAIAAAAVLGAGPAFAQSCPEGKGVLVRPLGHQIALDLAPGTSAVFTAGTVRVSCTGSHGSCKIPTIGNPGDPVIAVLSPPTCGSCTTNAGLSASTSTNNTNGNWSFGFSCGGNVTLHIPRGGVVSRVGSCTITAAPAGPVDVPASFVNGSTSNTLTISNALLPIAKSGLGCPAGSTATFSATFRVTDATDASQNITVTEVAL